MLKGILSKCVACGFVRIECGQGAWLALVLVFLGITGQTSAGLDRNDRPAVAAFFQEFYVPGVGMDAGWTGDISRCVAGATSPAYRDATLARINFYRVMAGLPGDVILTNTWSAKCQSAALMMSAQGAYSHFPDSSWKCYSLGGAEAAANSNVTLGQAGPEAIDGYMDDQGSANGPVGHRRWILYPPQKVMGTGSVPGTTGHWPANVLWVLGGAGARPSGPEFKAWPPAGFVPYQLLPKVSGRWSFSVAGADFSGAGVWMRHGGTNVPVVVQPPVVGFGDPTLVWNPQGVATWATRQDQAYSVTVSNVVISGVAKVFSYTVTVFDPDVPMLAVAEAGPGWVTLGWPGWASGYDLEESSSTGSDAVWVKVQGTALLGGGVYRLTVGMAAAGTGFFRLRKR